MEVARQMRLRNLGGLVIIDFIDMKNKGDQRKVFNKMKAAMADDKAKHNISPFRSSESCRSPASVMTKATPAGIRILSILQWSRDRQVAAGRRIEISARSPTWSAVSDGGGQGRFGSESISSPKRAEEIAGTRLVAFGEAGEKLRS